MYKRGPGGRWSAGFGFALGWGSRAGMRGWLGDEEGGRVFWGLVLGLVGFLFGDGVGCWRREKYVRVEMWALIKGWSLYG